MYYKTKKEIQDRLKEIADQVEFADDGHTYRRKSDGMYLHGVSSVISVIDKPYLMAWSTKENYKYLLENWDINKQYTEKEKKDLLLLAKNAYKDKSDTAKDLGKDIHKLAEEYIKARIAGTNNIKAPSNEIMKRAITEIIKWDKGLGVDWVASEAIVLSNYYNTAGTLDALGYVGKYLTLFDFKVANQIGETYYLQLAFYQLMLEEWGIMPDQRVIIQVPKEPDRELHQIVVPTPYEFDRRVAVAALEIKKWKEYCNNISKVSQLKK